MKILWIKARKALKQASPVDAKLVNRCLQGDQDAWETIVRSLAGRIFGLSYRYTGRKEEAEDLTQEIFIRIYQTLASFRAETGNFMSWALKVSRNLIIDHYRQTRRFQQLGGSAELESMNIADQGQPSAQRSVEQAEASRILRNALRLLSPETKEAIILRDLEGMGYHEMAEVLGVPEGTVKSRINRGRLALARSLSRNPAFAAAAGR
jgi:RNA polymerase sigma-70 factor (ECF subfamily)